MSWSSNDDWEMFRNPIMCWLRIDLIFYKEVIFCKTPKWISSGVQVCVLSWTYQSTGMQQAEECVWLDPPLYSSLFSVVLADREMDKGTEIVTLGGQDWNRRYVCHFGSASVCPLEGAMLLQAISWAPPGSGSAWMTTQKKREAYMRECCSSVCLLAQGF